MAFRFLAGWLTSAFIVCCVFHANAGQDAEKYTVEYAEIKRVDDGHYTLQFKT